MKVCLEIKMLTSFFTFVAAILNTVNADLFLKPRDTEAVVGDSTYFDCASNINKSYINWYHYKLGAKNHEDVCIYCLRKVNSQYMDRIQIERHNDTGSTRLKINSVRLEDAGVYVCQDNGGIGESTSAQLVVLESSPNCTSNITPEGLIGPNSCNIEPDELHLSCSVSYKGCIPPLIQWREINAEDPVENGVSCQHNANRMACNLTLKTDLSLNGASYICETNKSATTQYSCKSDIIRIIYARTDILTNKTIRGSGEQFNCSVNSSQACSYTWKWLDGIVEEFLSNDSVLTPWKMGWHKCEANCNIRGKQCTLLSKLLYVSETKNFLTQYWFIANSLTFMVICLFLISFITVCCCLGLHYIFKKKRTFSTGCSCSMQQFMSPKKQPMLTNNSKTNNNQLEKFKLNSTGALERKSTPWPSLKKIVVVKESIYCKAV